MSNGIQTIQAANNGVTAVTFAGSAVAGDRSAGALRRHARHCYPGTATDRLSTAANNSNATNNTLTFHVANGV